MGVVHPQLLRAQGHQGGELAFRSADPLGHGHGHVIGRLHRHRPDRLVHRDAVAGAHAEAGRGRAGGVGRDIDPVRQGQLARLQGLEGQVERHQLGDRRRIARAVGVLLVEHLAGVGVDDIGGVARLAEQQIHIGDLRGGRLGQGRGGQDDKHKERENAAGVQDHEASVRCTQRLIKDAANRKLPWLSPPFVKVKNP